MTAKVGELVFSRTQAEKNPLGKKSQPGIKKKKENEGQKTGRESLPVRISGKRTHKKGKHAGEEEMYQENLGDRMRRRRKKKRRDSSGIDVGREKRVILSVAGG